MKASCLTLFIFVHEALANVLCYASVRRVVFCFTMLCYDMPCPALPCHAMLLFCAMLCYAMLCYAMLCYAMLCYAMLCSIACLFLYLCIFLVPHDQLYYMGNRMTIITITTFMCHVSSNAKKLCFYTVLHRRCKKRYVLIWFCALPM
jgi:hypothetical protein